MNQKLTPPSPERQALVTEYARQMNSGEYHAGYWAWYGNGRYLDSPPQFVPSGEYSFEPAWYHPHYSIYKEWEAHKLSGAVDRGEYSLHYAVGHGDIALAPTEYTRWHVESSHYIEKTKKHPDNIKPKLKMIDWVNVPIGTMTHVGELRKIYRHFSSSIVGIVERISSNNSIYQHKFNCSLLRIVPATKWTAVQDGEEPPVCEGLVIEYRYAATDYLGVAVKSPIAAVTKTATQAGINAYRVIGIAKGWTDVPEEAV